MQLIWRGSLASSSALRAHHFLLELSGVMLNLMEQLGPETSEKSSE